MKNMQSYSIRLFVLVVSLLRGGAIFAAEGLGSSQTQSGGGVTIKVTYLAQTEHESRFAIALDTHSVNLDAYDFKTLSILRDDTGLVLQPTGIDKKGSGHHREIILTFPRPSMKSKWAELVIKDVAGEKERTFRWYR